MTDNLGSGDLLELIEIYKQAQITIIQEMVANADIEHASIYLHQEALLAQVNAKLLDLKRIGGQWVETAVPEAYQEGLDQANKSIRDQYRKAGEPFPEFPESFSVVHQESILSLIDSTRDVFDGLIYHTGRSVKDAIKIWNTEVIKEKISAGWTIKKTQQKLVEYLKDEGFKAVTFKRNGKDVSMDLASYAAMVARSTTREATNQASMRQAKEVSGDLIKMSSHIPCCDICFPLQGRVYSITGKTPGYPQLDQAFTSGYANIHPNCKHVINPYIAKFKSPAQLKKDKEFSNRPFDFEGWSNAEKKIYKRQMDAYNTAQKKKAKLLSDRKQYERYKTRLGDGAPGSFSAFRRMKNNPESWEKFQTEYREQGVIQRREDAGKAPVAKYTYVDRSQAPAGYKKGQNYEWSYFPKLKRIMQAGTDRAKAIWAGGFDRHLIIEKSTSGAMAFHRRLMDVVLRPDEIAITRYKLTDYEYKPNSELAGPLKDRRAQYQEILDSPEGRSELELDEIRDEIRDLNIKIRKLDKYPSFLYARDKEDAIVHEWGHALYYDLKDGLVPGLENLQDRNEPGGGDSWAIFNNRLYGLTAGNGPKISEYAAQLKYQGKEYFAEAWTVYVRGEDLDILDPFIVDIFDTVAQVKRDPVTLKIIEEDENAIGE